MLHSFFHQSAQTTSLFNVPAAAAAAAATDHRSIEAIMSAAPAPSAPAARAPELAEVAIIGVGVAGISVACKLQKAGIGPVVALEKGAEVGGTWSINRYPGAACDVPAHLYSLSFAWDFDWSRNFATQAGACVWFGLVWLGLAWLVVVVMVCGCTDATISPPINQPTDTSTQLINWSVKSTNQPNPSPYLYTDTDTDTHPPAHPTPTKTELLAYLKHVVTTHKLLEPAPGHTQPVVRLSTEVQEARWDGEMQRWAVRAVNNGGCAVCFSHRVINESVIM